MPLHFFNVHDRRIYVDDVGSDLPDLAAVRQEALRTAGELLRDGAAADLWSGEEWKLVVTDRSGDDVLTLRFSADPCREASPTLHGDVGRSSHSR